jgi:tRNA threonylcarbamoyladenosine biosynthesis protein TsaB
MKGACLAIESATSRLSLALYADGTFQRRTVDGVASHADQLYGLVEELLIECELTLGSLDCVAFGAGPGSFTGVRLAMSAAQSLAYAAGLPVCPVSSLEALAVGCHRLHHAERVLCAVDARRGEIYAGLYQTGDDRVDCLIADCVIGPDELDWQAHTFFAAGSGWNAYPELSKQLADQIIGIDGELLPDARDIARTALSSPGRTRWCKPGAASPSYVRDKVADESAAVDNSSGEKNA